ncbi:MAG: phosphopyruvate hydratase [Patescibacteria group bacterium]|nr:phosphopyruvate hydratase [Patescibacteria group bacterium]
MKIGQVNLKIINDSRKEPTLEAELVVDGVQGAASVPSGKSKGSNEVFVLDPQAVIQKLDEIKPKLIRDFNSLEEFDQFLIQLDGTPKKENLGGNLILALSIAFVRAWAKLQNLETFQLISKISKQETKLPLCFFNLIEGGVHAENSLPFQEYLFIPQTNSPKESLNMVGEFIKALAEYEHEEFGKLKMGDEGGFTVPSKDPEIGLRILQEVMGKITGNAKSGLDIAASTFLENDSYNVSGKIMDRDDLISYYQLLAVNYQLLSIEDPFAENDWEGFEKIMTNLGEKVWIVGDDLTTTNVESIKLAYERNAVNAVIIKPNQIGSVTEAINAAVLAKSYGWKIIVSHRSGETMDNFIADFAAGLGADGLKSGCPLQQERLVKYRRLEEIEKIWRI